MTRLGGAAVLVAIAVIGAGCGVEEVVSPAPLVDAGPDMPDGGLLDWEVDQLGPFHVGYRSLQTSYENPVSGATREITVNVWYPTLDTEGPSPAYLHAFLDPDVIEGATLAPPQDPAGYPVHLYSHGNWGFGGTSSDLMHWFASHGWVAIAPDHAGNTLPDMVDKIPLAIHYLRTTDLSASLDVLENLPAGDPLSGKHRTDRVLLSGHSFGTLTAWATGGAEFDVASVQAKCDAGDFSEPCQPDEIALFAAGLGDARIAAGLPMAGGVGDEPGWFGLTGYDAAQKPYLLMSGSADPVGAENVFERVTALDFTWLDFVGGCHQLFALGGCQDLDEKEGWALVDTYALAFARRHILDDPSARIGAILDGSEILSDKVVFQKK
jgi:predicted dienelactone hydrolase